jgi:hypothetical protein
MSSDPHVPANASGTTPAKVVFWHRELPPLDADVVSEHVVEAESNRVPGTIAHRDELWRECEVDLMARAQARIGEELSRMGGRYAHVLQEFIEPRHDYVTGTAWLRGRFTYALYR